MTRRVAAIADGTTRAGNWVTGNQTLLGETCVLLDSAIAQRRLNQLFKKSGYDTQAFAEIADSFADEVCSSSQRSPDDVLVAFVCSVLVDMTHWGALPLFRESRLFVHWPGGVAESSPELRRQMRRALERLKGKPAAYKTDLTAGQALDFLAQGSVELVAVPRGESDLGDIWRAGVSTWSMPYRSREGRSKRFVVFTSLNKMRVPMGLLEVGDDAPHNPVRDRALGMTDDTALLAATPAEIADRLRNFRNALRPEGLPFDPRSSLEALTSQVEHIADEGRGRQGTAHEVNFRKRLTYLARFVRGEMAFNTGDFSSSRTGDGVRAIRDIAIPRINTEMTICGALPPFGTVLGGKVVAAMAGHPAVREVLDRSFGEITAAMFEENQLRALLPTRGAMFITTKGLYPGHSAQYKGVRVPGRNGPVPLDKLGDTVGQTTSHLSDRSMRLAVESLSGQSERHVSREYGSGGGKRQRTLQQAALHAGLPGQFIYAMTSRPVYGVALADNIPRVLLVNEEPIWRVDPHVRAQDPVLYETAALEQWRRQWLTVATRRSTSS